MFDNINIVVIICLILIVALIYVTTGKIDLFTNNDNVTTTTQQLNISNDIIPTTSITYSNGLSNYNDLDYLKNFINNYKKTLITKNNYMKTLATQQQIINNLSNKVTSIINSS